MIAFLLANRWAAELAGIVLALAAFYGYMKVHDHTEQQIGQAECQKRVTQTTADAKIEENKKEIAYAAQLAQAERQRTEDLSRIPVHTDPIIVHDGAICPNPVQIGTGPASVDPGARGTDDGRRGDIDLRPLVERFEQKYEAALADCRKVIADWPH